TASACPKTLRAPTPTNWSPRPCARTPSRRLTPHRWTWIFTSPNLPWASLRERCMLESVWHQGTGLHWQCAQSSLRVLLVVPSGDSADATALWMACAQLQQQGYPVVVLDGTEQESPSLPGLQDMLQPRQGY